MRREALLTGTILGAVVALVVAACGGGAEPTKAPPPAPPTTAPAPAATAAPAPTTAPAATAVRAATATPVPAPTAVPPTATPTAQIRRGGTIFREAGTGDMPSRDISKLDHPAQAFNLDNIWSWVTMYKGDSFEDATIIGDLAERWEVGKAGATFTFRLNPKARWQNIAPMNGREVTAADVKWWLDLTLDPKFGSARKGWVSAIQSVEAPDKNTLVINLDAPTNNFLHGLSWVNNAVLPREVFERDGNFEKTTVGSGPYIFDRWESAVKIVNKRNPNFWQDGADGRPLPYTDAIETLIIEDANTKIAALKAGKLTLLGVQQTPLAAAPLIGAPDVVLVPIHVMLYNIVGMNHTVKPFDDVRVRRAFLKAVDVGAYRSNGIKATEADSPLESFVHTGMRDFPYAREKLQKQFTRDVEGARKLLAEAGYSSSNPLRVPLFFRTGSSPWQLVIQQQLEEIGVKTAVDTSPTTAVGTTRMQKSDFQVILTATHQKGDPISHFTAQWRTGAGTNYWKYSNPKVDALIDDAQRELDVAQFKKKVEGIQDAMWEDTAGIPLPAGSQFAAHRKELKGYANHWVWGNQNIRWAWLDK